MEECLLSSISENEIAIEMNKRTRFYFSKYGTAYSYPKGEVCCFPPRKCAWKKGDVLADSRGFKVLFDKWVNNDYTKFSGKDNYMDDSVRYDPADYTLVSKEEASKFIKNIENIYRGKLNLDTLDIEKAQPEFKDGDIVFEEGNRNYCSAIGVLKKDEQGCFMFDTFLTKDKVCYNSEYIYIYIFQYVLLQKKRSKNSLTL